MKEEDLWQNWLPWNRNLTLKLVVNVRRDNNIKIGLFCIKVNIEDHGTDPTELLQLNIGYHWWEKVK